MKNRNKKSFALIIALVLLVTAAAGGTLAFLKEQTGAVQNTFVTTEIISTVDEDFEDGEKSNVAIVNTSEDVSAFIRAAVVINWKKVEDGETMLLPAAAGDYTIVYGNENWYHNSSDGYYYYTETVPPLTPTKDLIVSCKPVEGKAPDGYSLDVVVLGSAIQCVPKDAVTESWGVDPTAFGS